jgi:hypothetical protein
MSERDPDIIAPNVNEAHKHLALLTPYPEPFGLAQPSDPHAPWPPVHPSFVFVAGEQRLAGTLEECKERLIAAHYAGTPIHVEMDAATCIVADAHLKPRLEDVPLPGNCWPSIVSTLGSKLDQQWTWLLSEPATAEERKAIAEAVRAYGGAVQSGKTVRIRLAGFGLVHATGSPETQGSFAVRWEPGDLARQLEQALAAQEA